MSAETIATVRQERESERGALIVLYCVTAAVFGIAGLGMVGTLVPVRPVIVVSLIILSGGMSVTQATAPAFVNLSARGATGSAGVLYLAFYYLDATFGSVVPGYGWQAWGWHGVAATCGAGLMLALLADWLLCARASGVVTGAAL